MKTFAVAVIIVLAVIGMASVIRILWAAAKGLLGVDSD